MCCHVGRIVRRNCVVCGVCVVSRVFDAWPKGSVFHSTSRMSASYLLEADILLDASYLTFTGSVKYISE